jgi:hypothetical protein
MPNARSVPTATLAASFCSGQANLLYTSSGQGSATTRNAMGNQAIFMTSQPARKATVPKRVTTIPKSLM